MTALLTRIGDRIQTEPVIALDLIKAVLVALAAFGVTVSDVQMTALTALAWTLLTLVQRQLVSPVAATG